MIDRLEKRGQRFKLPTGSARRTEMLRLSRPFDVRDTPKIYVIELRSKENHTTEHFLARHMKVKFLPRSIVRVII